MCTDLYIALFYHFIKIFHFSQMFAHVVDSIIYGIIHFGQAIEVMVEIIIYSRVSL